MDNQLESLLKIDRCTNTARIDILGSLTPASRPDLLHEIHRVRGMGITSSITVDLSRAAFVESCALAGLRMDLNAQDASLQGESAAAAPGISLVVMAGGGQEAAETGNLTALPQPSLPQPSQPVAAPDPSGVRQLSSYSSEELLAASDSVFKLLDDPSGRWGQELLAHYEAIGAELTRRELFEESVEQAAGS